MIERHLRLALLAAAVALLPAAARAGTGANFSGSVYLDYWGMSVPSVANRSPTGVTPEASLKVAVDVHDDLSFSAKACFSCHGVEPEHVMLEWTPRSWFNVQAGRIAVPFGEFSQRVDPASHRTASKPLIYDMGRMAYGERTDMNLGVIPMPYVDTGVLAYGQFWLGGHLQVWYGGYGVAGFRGTNDFEFKSMRTPPYTDNNRFPAGGGRVAVTLSTDSDVLSDLSVGGSFTAGRYDPAATLGYKAWGADFSARIWKATLRGEYAFRRTDLDPTARLYTSYGLIDAFFDKSGFYVELEHPLLSHVTAVYRLDGLRRQGIPLPKSDTFVSADDALLRYTAGIVVTPAAATFMKLTYEYWGAGNDDFGNGIMGLLRWKRMNVPPFHSIHFGLGGSF